MPCEHYKDALIEVAALGAAPQAELCAHLDECPSCRAAFAEEQSLFAVINSNLHTVANAEVPTSLVPRVRARLDEATEAKPLWERSLALASASVALALAVFLLAHTHHDGPEDVAKLSPAAVPTPTALATIVNPEGFTSEGTLLAAIPVRHSRVSRNSTGVHSAASGNVEILVPPDEREGLAQLVAALNEHSDLAAALLTQHPEKKDALVTVEPLQTSDVEIKPLDSPEAGASDGAADKH